MKRSLAYSFIATVLLIWVTGAQSQNTGASTGQQQSATTKNTAKEKTPPPPPASPIRVEGDRKPFTREVTIPTATTGTATQQK